MAVKHVAVIGAGTIGASWAAYFLSRGMSVTASDPAPNGEAFIRDYVRTAWPTLERTGLVPGASPDRLRFERDPVAAVAGAGFVQESAPEREEMKVELFERLDRALPPEVILASSSSGIPISNIAVRCRHAERCIIGHPFNPPHVIPLVEVVGGKRTSPKVIERAIALYREIGKHPIHIRKEVRGHLVNRLQAALWREAVHLVNEGVATVGDVDAGIAYGPGLRWAIMGPHLLFHLAGGIGGMTHFMPHLGVTLARDWWRDLGSPELTPEVQKKIIDGVADEAGGRSIPELAAERDRCLIAILEALKAARGAK
ncbi:MAG TPA: 3-hydroxyacyl-CoA dehydrogenase NAD-binding domain-containing protein [Stellaceae bacterium]|nr:3-hydroxyacyl-CoA dehydrogenase NAD-binding domain-containing protein [Stellaceae bacterium]